jgi:hypothetical protein
MNLIFMIALGGALAAVLIVLGLGIFSLARGGAFAKKYGNRLMRARLITQALAIVLLVIAYLAR